MSYPYFSINLKETNRVTTLVSLTNYSPSIKIGVVPGPTTWYMMLTSLSLTYSVKYSLYDLMTFISIVY